MGQAMTINSELLDDLRRCDPLQSLKDIVGICRLRSMNVCARLHNARHVIDYFTGHNLPRHQDPLPWREYTTKVRRNTDDRVICRQRFFPDSPSLCKEVLRSAFSRMILNVGRFCRK